VKWKFVALPSLPRALPVSGKNELLEYE